jgi:glycosyltransferase involved in cell wall biosynthesis
LFLVPSLSVGGAERQLALLARALSSLGVQIHVGFVHSGVNLSFVEGSDVTLHQIRCLGNYDPTILWRVLAIIRTVKPDVIQTWFQQMDVFGGLAAMLARVPFVLSERSSALAYPRTWKNSLRLAIGRRASAIVANSEGGAAYWAAQTNAPRVEVIRNGLPLDLIRAAVSADPASLGLPRDARIVLFAGRLSPEKNVDTLVQALDDVLPELLNCAALLLGEGPLRGAIQSRLARSRSRDRIYLQQFTPDVWRWMRRAAVFVSVSFFEGNPNGVLEAMAIGCPLVVSDIPPHREILDDSAALFCNPHSVPDVAGAIRKALGDTATANARVEVARQRSAQWTIADAASQHISLYKRLALAHVVAK